MTKKLKLQINNFWLIIIISSFLIVGIIIGSLFANKLNSEKKEELVNYIENFVNEYKTKQTNQLDIFKESFVKYIKIVLIIWFVAYVPFGFLFCAAVLIYKGISFGFTTSIFIMGFGFKGITYTLGLYFIQNFILIPAFIFITFASFRFKQTFLKDKKNNTSQFEYFIFLLLGSGCVVLASFIESYFIPQLIKNLIF